MTVEQCFIILFLTINGLFFTVPVWTLSGFRMKSPLPPSLPSKLSYRDKRALKLFFWVALVIGLILVFAAPSINAGAILLSIIALGAPLFRDSKQRLEPTDPAGGNDRDLTRLTVRAWLVLITCAVATPLVFGILPTTGPKLAAFLIVAWMGLFIGGALMLIIKVANKSPADKSGK